MKVKDLLPERNRKMENVALEVALYRHNGVVLSPLGLLYLFYHLWHDFGHKCRLSLRREMDERGL